MCNYVLDNVLRYAERCLAFVDEKLCSFLQLLSSHAANERPRNSEY